MKKINVFYLQLTTFVVGVLCTSGTVLAQVYNENAPLEWIVSESSIQNVITPQSENSGNTEWVLEETVLKPEILNPVIKNTENTTSEWIVSENEVKNVTNPQSEDLKDNNWNLKEIFPEENQPTNIVQTGGTSNSSRTSLNSSLSTSVFEKDTTKSLLVSDTELTTTSLKASTKKDVIINKPTSPQKIVSNSPAPDTNSKPIIQKSTTRTYNKTNTNSSSVKNFNPSNNVLQNLKGSDLVIVTPQKIKFRTRLQAWNSLEDDISSYNIALFFRQIGTGIQMIFFALLGMILAMIFRDFPKIRKFVLERIEFRVPIIIKTK